MKRVLRLLVLVAMALLILGNSALLYRRFVQKKPSGKPVTPVVRHEGAWVVLRFEATDESTGRQVTIVCRVPEKESTRVEEDAWAAIKLLFGLEGGIEEIPLQKPPAKEADSDVTSGEKFDVIWLPDRHPDPPAAPGTRAWAEQQFQEGLRQMDERWLQIRIAQAEKETGRKIDYARGRFADGAKEPLPAYLMQQIEAFQQVPPARENPPAAGESVR